MLEAMRPGLSHVIIEFKQGKDLESLKQEALSQIKEKKYYAPLQGEILLICLAHNGKECQMAYERIVHKV